MWTSKIELDVVYILWLMSLLRQKMKFRGNVLRSGRHFVCVHMLAKDPSLLSLEALHETCLCHEADLSQSYQAKCDAMGSSSVKVHKLEAVPRVP